MSTEFINLENAHVYSKSPVSPGGLTTQAVNKSVHTIQANEVWAEEIPFIPTFNSETITEQIKGHPISLHTNKLTLLTSDNNNGIGANGYAARVFINDKPVEQFISETDKIEDGKLSIGYKPLVFLENGVDLMPSSDYIVNCSSGIVYFFKEVTSDNYSLRYFTYDGKKLSDINGSLNDSFEEIKTNIEKNTTKIDEVEKNLETTNTEIDNIHSDIEEIILDIENLKENNSGIENIDSIIISEDIIISDDVTADALQIEAAKSEETPSLTSYTFTTNIYNKSEVDNKIAEVDDKIAAVENTFTVSDSIDTNLTTPVGITSNGSRDYTLTYNTYTTSEVDTKLQSKVDEIAINEDETVISIVLDETSNNKKYVVSSDTYNKSVIDEKIELSKTTIKIADSINTDIETPISISSAVTDSGSTEYTIDYNTYNTSEIDTKVNSKIGDIIVDDECPTLTITSETVDNNKIYTINSNAYTAETVDNKIAETKNEIIDIINDKVIVVERASDDNSADDVLTVTNTLTEGSSDIYTIRVNAYNKAQTEEKINAALEDINLTIGERSEEDFRPSNNPDNSIWQTIDNLHDKFNDRLAGLINSTISNIAGDSFINIDKDADTNTHEISLRTASSIDFEQNPGTTVPTTAAVKAAIDAVKNNAGSGGDNPVISTINLVGDSFINTNKNEYGDTWQVSLNVSSDIASEENPQTTIPTVEATKNSINSVEQTFSENLANHASSNTHLKDDERDKWDSYEGTISGINDLLNTHTTDNDIHISAAEREKLNNLSNDELAGLATSIDELETDLSSHTSNTIIHITQEDRDRWDNAENPLKSSIKALIPNEYSVKGTNRSGAFTTFVLPNDFYPAGVQFNAVKIETININGTTPTEAYLGVMAFYPDGTKKKLSISDNTNISATKGNPVWYFSTPFTITEDYKLIFYILKDKESFIEPEPIVDRNVAIGAIVYDIDVPDPLDDWTAAQTNLNFGFIVNGEFIPSKSYPSWPGCTLYEINHVNNNIKHFKEGEHEQLFSDDERLFATTEEFSILEENINAINNEIETFALTTDLEEHSTDDSIHVTQDEKNTWNSKLSSISASSSNNNYIGVIVNNGNNVAISPNVITDISTAVTGKLIDANTIKSYVDEHTSDGDIHITIDDKNNWNTSNIEYKALNKDVTSYKDGVLTYGDGTTENINLEKTISAQYAFGKYSSSSATTISEFNLRTIKPDYTENDGANYENDCVVSDDETVNTLANLINGRGMFLRSNLTTFNDELPCLMLGDVMFKDSKSLSNFRSPLPSLTCASGMFRGCTSLTTFRTKLPSLSRAKSMFNDDSELTTVDTCLPNLTYGNNMFSNCPKLTIVNLSSTSLSNLYDGTFMFHCNTTRDFNKFRGDLSALETAEYMFTGCRLDLESVTRIADTIRDWSSDNSSPCEHRIGIGINSKSSWTDWNKFEEQKIRITNKGWVIAQWQENGVDPEPMESATLTYYYAKPASGYASPEYIDENGNKVTLILTHYTDCKDEYEIVSSREEAEIRFNLTKIEKIEE